MRMPQLDPLLSFVGGRAYMYTYTYTYIFYIYRYMYMHLTIDARKKQ